MPTYFVYFRLIPRMKQAGSDTGVPTLFHLNWDRIGKPVGFEDFLTGFLVEDKRE